MNDTADNLVRYQRQMILPDMGLAAQRKLGSSKALIVGVGGLGSWMAELLTRAGVGALRLIDPDNVDLTNLHRQALYTEHDARLARPKVEAAAERLASINSHAAIEPIVGRLDRHNIAALAEGVDVILDGTDNFLARYIINDYAVKMQRPWVFAGAVGTEAQILAILPGQSACLRCILPDPPPPCHDPNCRQAGVLGPVVAAVAAMQAVEAIKILSGRSDAARSQLLKFDLWTNRVQQISANKSADCPCCGLREFDYLEG